MCHPVYLWGRKTMQFLVGAGSLYRRHSSRLRRLCKSIKSKERRDDKGDEEGGGGEETKRSPYADLISLDHAKKIQVR